MNDLRSGPVAEPPGAGSQQSDTPAAGPGTAKPPQRFGIGAKALALAGFAVLPAAVDEAAGP